jgi:phosphohistidine phosphatase
MLAGCPPRAFIGPCMKTLLLVRHAKSSRDEPSLPDTERQLSGRGRRDAPRMGRRLHERGIELDLMVSSPALRALATAKIIARQLRYPRTRIAVDDRLYPGAARTLLEVIRGLDESLARVMLVGHNPGLSELAHRFASAITDLPTCAVAEFTFDTGSWRDLGRVEARNVTLESPKMP